MTADSQKAMDHNLIGLKKTFCFIVGIIIMNKGSEDKNFQLATDCSKKTSDKKLCSVFCSVHYLTKSIHNWANYSIF